MVKEKFAQNICSRSQNIMNMIVCKNTFVFYVLFFMFFMFLLTAVAVKNNQTLAGIYFIFLKKRPRPILKRIKDQI